MKVLYHIDQQAKWPMVLENVKNMLNYGKQNNETFQIEVVSNGEAVLGIVEHIAQKSKWYLEMNEYNQEGVIFAACNNALGKFNPAKSDLCAFVKVVPAGVVEIASKSMEGFTYIKP